LLLKKSAFDEYICSEEYAEDNAVATISAMVSLQAPPSTGGGSGNSGASGTAATGSNVVSGTMTAQEFRRGVKRDIAHYTNFKDDEHFSAWHRKFVATACMLHTHLVLGPKYVPQDDVAKAVFEEMQIFMYAVMAEHFKTEKGKSLVSQYEKDQDAQSIYRDLKKHALGSTSAWLPSDKLLKYITLARYPGNWRGTASAFVLHWNEQVKRYKTLEVEDFPPKQKLHMIQNAIRDMTELAQVKQLADLGVSNGNAPLTYDSYLALLLEACATFDTRRELPRKQKRAVYTMAISGNNLDEPYGPVDDAGYTAYSVDTTISEIMVDAADSNQFSGKSGNHSQSSSRIPYSELVGFPTLSGLR
jgi:hypothetical protein